VGVLPGPPAGRVRRDRRSLTESPTPGLERIRDLLRAAPLVDGHNDLLWELRKTDGSDGALDVSVPREGLHSDLPRMAAGGVGGQFWSVFVPSDLPALEGVTATLEQVDAFFGMLRRHPDRLELARTADDVERVAAAGRVASMLGIEGGHAIGCSLGTLRVLASFGAGYLTLTHNDDTPWADSATGDRAHGGLTRFGEEVVRELNRSGLLVDLSHTSPDTMRQAIAVSEAPVIFSHSSARARCDVARNVPDDVLELVARNDGVVMVTFVPMFLTAAGAEAMREALEVGARARAEHPDDPGARRAAMDAFYDLHPDPPATVGDVADHVDHVRAVAGIDHVGIGSDFDGSPSMPEGLEDVSRYPALFAELAGRGYTDDDLAKIAGRNVLRVLREAERTSARLTAERPPSRATIEQLDDDRRP
jgi:membrane dipeptidase